MLRSTLNTFLILAVVGSLVGPVWAACPDGDLDNDCQVDFNDVRFLADCWLDSPGSPANLVGQDQVNMADFSVIATHWGEVGERTGSVEVEITPRAAINLGAKWRVNGGAWQDSGQRVNELVVGFYIIEFKPIDSWAKPADAEIYVSGDWISALNSAYKHPLKINEFMASNSGNALNPPEGNAKDEHGQYDDWIEIFNSGDEAIDAAGMYLIDGDGNKWQFPSNNPLTNIASGGYLLIWADDWTDNDVNDGPLHTNFKLSAGGDEISLYDSDGESLIDSADFGDQTNDISYGRDANDNWRFFPYPSPRWENNDAYLGAVEDTKFSHDRGFYDAPFSVTIVTETTGATIKYTTNDSAPSETVGQEYTGPIPINTTKCLRAMAFRTGWKPTDIDTHTYIFLANVINQPPNPPGFPSTWDGKTADYDMNPAVISRYTYAELANSLLSLPSISIVTDMANLFDNSIGIYENPTGSGVEWERPASAEWIDHSGGPEFQVNCGLRMQGQAARNTLKKPFRLLFKTIYGASKLEFPMFEESGNAAESFDTITLRSNSQGPNYLGAKTQITDENGRRTLLDMGTPQSHGTSVHLYVNGLYWGLYNAVERPQASFCVNYFGGEKEEWDAKNGNEAIDGTRDIWDAMIAQVQAGLADNAAYQKIQGNNPDGTRNPDFPVYLDMPNYIDYMLCNFYIGTGDWAGNLAQGNRNYYCARRRTENDDPGFKWFVWDAERSLQSTNNTGVSYGPAEPYSILKSNAEFKLLFADHIQRNMFNNGALTAGAGLTRFIALMDMVRAPIIAEEARWDLTSVATWESNTSDRVSGFFPSRTDTVLGYLKNIGLYPNIVAPVFRINGSDQHGGYISSTDSFSIAPGSGTFYYTIDGSDPRLPGGAINTAHAITYSDPITLSRSTRVRARLKNGSTWSALSEAVFAVGQVAESLRIIEIMYHPQETGNPDDPNEEFIELRNIGLNPINLNLVRFTNGIDFTFPAIELAPAGEPGDHVVVVKDQAAFTAAHPGFSGVVAGEYTGSLDNGGERIELQDALGRPIMDFRYEDGWRSLTDGLGFSLTIIDPNDIVMVETRPPLAGLVAHWKLDDGSGNTATDSAGTYNGVVHGRRAWSLKKRNV